MSEVSTEKSKSEIEDGKNVRNVFCEFCDTKILCSKSAEFVNAELPLIRQKKSNESSNTSAANEPECELINEFWHVKDMYTFENVGFSNTVADTKYLTCANCDIGPIGYYKIPTKESFVALTRVRHI